MEIHLEPERVIFTAALGALLLLQVIFSVRAWNHYRMLRRLGANTLQMQLVGIDWYVEFSRLYVVVGGFVIGLLSFIATSTPRSVFSVVATGIITSWVVIVEFGAWRADRHHEGLLSEESQRRRPRRRKEKP